MPLPLPQGICTCSLLPGMCVPLRWPSPLLRSLSKCQIFSEVVHGHHICFLICCNKSPQTQLSSVTQSCPTLCDPMDCSKPGFPVHLQLPEFAQTHVHQVGDAVQPSHPLSYPSPPAFNLSQHQGLQMSQFFASGGQTIGVSASASVLPMNIQN